MGLFDDNFEQYLLKVKNLQEQFKDLTEEATKNALVMPFFAMLGYDVFDTNEFMPEFVCDFGTKKGEKIDYAILKDGEPVMMIEVKRAGAKLQKQQQAQLYRYFATNHCRIAILTNGVTYQFFSDLNSPNVMDDDPFFSFNLIDDDPHIYKSALKQFCKDDFHLKNVISNAVYQKYAKVVEKTLKQDLTSPSDEIVKYFLSRPEIKTGNRITSQMIEKYRDITQKSMQKVMGTTIQNISNPETLIQNNITNNFVHQEIQVLTASETANKISEYALATIQDFQCQREDISDCIKMHIYSSNRKVAIIKVMKSNSTIQFRKVGTPISYDLKTVEEVQKCLKEI